MAHCTCSVAFCVKPAKSRGWCEAHYRRWYRTGSIELLAFPADPPPLRPGERWAHIPGYENRYEASDLGLIRSVNRVVVDKLGRVRRLKGVLLQPAVCVKDGRITHLSVQLGDRNSQHVHVLVLLTFVGPRPRGKEGCHNDGNPTNNRATNLRWDTRSANHLDKQRHGTDAHRNRVACPREHLLKAPNLKSSAWKHGHRECLACSRARSMEHYYLRTYGGVRAYDFAAAADCYYAEITKAGSLSGTA